MPFIGSLHLYSNKYWIFAPPWQHWIFVPLLRHWLSNLHGNMGFCTSAALSPSKHISKKIHGRCRHRRANIRNKEYMEGNSYEKDELKLNCIIVVFAFTTVSMRMTMLEIIFALWSSPHWHNRTRSDSDPINIDTWLWFSFGIKIASRYLNGDYQL